jgi:hypothetical protein
MEIDASEGTVFEAAFGEFLLEVGRTGGKVQATASCCGHGIRGVDFSKAIQLYGLWHAFLGSKLWDRLCL